MAVFCVTFDSSTGQIKAQKVGSDQIGNGAVLSAHIGAGVIATPHIANQGLLSASIAAQVGAAHFYTPPFTSGYVIIGQGSGVTPVYGSPPAGAPGDNTITSAKIASGQVGDGHIYPGSIISGKIGANIIALSHFERFNSGKIIVGQGTGTNPIYTDNQAVIGFVIDGGGAVITSGLKGHIEVPFGATINRCTLLAQQSGNIDIAIWKNTYGNFQALAQADSICSSWPPHTSGDIKYQDSVLSNWVKTIASGDVLAYYTNAASSIQRCTVSLGVYR